MASNRCRIPGIDQSSVRRILLLLVCILYFLNAYVLDDAYITFRVADNALHGHGLTWNPGERVQAYTNPLWLFVCILLAGCTGEFFLTSIVAQFLLFLGTMLIAEKAIVSAGEREPCDAWRMPAFLLVVAASKAVFDYSSSGLENPLTHLLMLFFMVRVWELERVSGDAVESMPAASIKAGDPAGVWNLVWWSLFIAALGAVNRLDTLFCHAVPLAFILIRHFERSWLSARRVLGLFLAVLPLVCWEVFTVVYYGFPFPNTGYAKMLTIDLTFADKLRQGIAYLLNSAQSDPVSSCVVLGAILLAVTRRRTASVALLGGALGYAAFIVAGGAIATHMSGRLFSLPIFVAIMVVFKEVRSRPALIGTAAAALLAIILLPNSCLWAGSDRYRPLGNTTGIIDVKNTALREDAGLLRNLENLALAPDTAWFQDGREFRRHPADVHIGGGFGGWAIGFFGFAAGPSKKVIDILGLSDPLLARLPTVRHASVPYGHFERLLPDGYPETVRDGVNSLKDPAIREYYDRLCLITRGPLFSRKRLAALWDLNRLRPHPLIERYKREELEPRLRKGDAFRLQRHLLGPFP